jgi:hypothetical protein
MGTIPRGSSIDDVTPQEWNSVVWNGCTCSSCLPYAEIDELINEVQWQSKVVQLQPQDIPKPQSAGTPSSLWDNSGGFRDDANKAEFGLLPAEALEAVVDVLTQGAHAVGPDNWRAGFQWRRTFGSMMRHGFAWLRGEDLDKKSGKPHMAHLVANGLFLLQFYLTKTGTDDRFRSNP